LIHRAKKGGRTALTLCVERLLPRLKDVAELPVEQSREDPQSTTNQHTEPRKLDLSALTQDDVGELERLPGKTRLVNAGSDRGRAPAAEPAQNRRAVSGDRSAPA
jgi:hypothetical protein